MKRNQQTRKRGIALITVICLLAMLVLMAVTFAVAMRTERIASRTDVDLAKARQLTHAALTRAMDNIDLSLDNSGSTFFMYPPWTMTFTTNGSMTCKNLITSNSLTFVPGIYRSLVAAATNQALGWITITNPVVTSQTLGRFAYLALNVSGMPDIETINRTNFHVRGVSGAETQIAGLTYATDIATSLALTNQYVHFETMRECTRANANNLTVNTSAYPAYRLPSTATPYRPLDTNFFLFDKYPSTPITTIQGQMAPIVQAFINSGLTATEASYAFTNLVDYVDSKMPPVPVYGTDYPSLKPVPMISEIVGYNSAYLKGGTSCVCTAYITVETWFPFTSARPVGYKVSTTTPTPTFNPTTLDGPWTIITASNTFISTTSTINIATTGYFATNQFHIAFQAACSNLPLQITMTIPLKDFYVKNSAATAVDHVPVLPSFILTWKLPNVSTWDGYACNDPRFNWTAAQWTHESQAQMSLMKPNWANGLFPLPTVLDTNLFCRCGSFSNAAEMAFFNIGQPWQSIRLYDDANGGMHRILDYFGSTNQTNFARGLINLNTQVPGVGALAFNQTPIYIDPTNRTAATTPITAAEAQQIATKLSALTLAASTAAATNQNHLSIVGNAIAKAGMARWATLPENQRKMLVADSYRLLHPRQNLFLIFFAGESGNLNPLNNAFVAQAQQSAVALVWRDPCPDTTGKHHCFVRFFKWLPE